MINYYLILPITYKDLIVDMNDRRRLNRSIQPKKYSFGTTMDDETHLFDSRTPSGKSICQNISSSQVVAHRSDLSESDARNEAVNYERRFCGVCVSTLYKNKPGK